MSVEGKKRGGTEAYKGKLETKQERAGKTVEPRSSRAPWLPSCSRPQQRPPRRPCCCQSGPLRRRPLRLARARALKVGHAAAPPARGKKDSVGRRDSKARGARAAHTPHTPPPPSLPGTGAPARRCHTSSSLSSSASSMAATRWRTAGRRSSPLSSSLPSSTISATAARWRRRAAARRASPSLSSSSLPSRISAFVVQWRWWAEGKDRGTGGEQRARRCQRDACDA